MIGAVFLLGLSPAVFSQTTSGLTGTVTDLSGATMPGGKVTLTSTETGAQRESTSNEAGTYEFTALQPGSYKLTFQKQGFAQVTSAAIRLEVNQVARLDVSMHPGAVNENIEVTAAAALLEVEQFPDRTGDRDESRKRSASERPQFRPACDSGNWSSRRGLWSLRYHRQRYASG